MQEPQGLGVGAGEALDVDVLAADHAVDPGRGRDLPDRGEDPVGLALLGLGDEADGLGEERVAGEDRDVLAEGHV